MKSVFKSEQARVVLTKWFDRFRARLEAQGRMRADIENERGRPTLEEALQDSDIDARHPKLSEKAAAFYTSC